MVKNVKNWKLDILRVEYCSEDYRVRSQSIMHALGTELLI